MASTHKSLRSGTANKRPTTAIAEGQIALNTNAASPGLYFKDSTGASIIKIGPVHVGTTAPNVAPAGSSGNSNGETWLDTSLTPNGWKVWTGAAWVNATPVGSATVQGLLELATDAETQAGSDTARAVTPAGLQSKVSDSTSTTSSTTIASSTAVKSAYDLANAALPKSGGTVTGNLEIGTSGSLTFEGATADAFETAIAVVGPTADRTITFPDTTGTVVTTGDTGTVTSAMIANGTIVDADVSASAEIAVSKLADGAARQLLQTDAAGTGVEWTTNVDVPGTLDVTGTTTLDSTLSVPLGSAAAPTVFFTGDSNTGIYSPGADQVAITTGGTGRLFIDSSGRLLAGTSTARTNFFGTTLSSLTQIEGTGGSTARGSLSVLNNDVSNNPPYVLLGRSGAATLGSNAVVVSGSRLGTLTFHGADGTSFIEAATVAGEVDGTPGTNDMPGRLVFSTTADGAASPTERLRITSTGQIQAASLGTAAAPIYSFLNDPNTGIYSPGADQVAVSTGGSGRLFIDASGNVALGAATFSKPFTISNQNAAISLRALSAGTYSDQGIFFAVDGTNYAQIYNDGPGTIIFRNGAGLSERLRIDATGRLLVGTSTSITALIAAGLQVQSTGANAYTSIGRWDNNGANPGLIFNKSRGGSVGTLGIVQSGDNLGEVSFTGDDGSAFVYAARIQAQVDGTPGVGDMPGRLTFSTTADGAASPTERLRITSTGDVGIGTSSPSSLLDISGSYPSVSNNSNDYRLRWRRTDGSFIGGLKVDGFDKLTFALSDAGGTTQDRMVINSSGNVGIGTTSPLGFLHIESPATTAGWQLRLDSVGLANESGFYRTATDNYEMVLRNGLGGLSYLTNKGGASTSTLEFNVQSSERARIDSSGRLLVGTSTATTNLRAQQNFSLVTTGNNNIGGASFTSYPGVSASSRSILDFQRSRGTTDGSLTIVASGDELGSVIFRGSDGAQFADSATVSAQVDGTPGTNSMPGRLTFLTTPTGSTTALERMRINANGTMFVVTGGTATCQVNSTTATAGTAAAVFLGRHSGTAGTPDSGTNSVNIFSNGNVTNTNNSYGAISDAKLKENIVDAGSQWDDLKALQVRKYNLKEETGQETHTQIGLVAQEVELVSPGLVSESPDRDAEGNDLGTVTKSVNYSVLYMKAVKALQEAMERIETLEAKVAALESA
jgi:hypothetical protein